MAFPSIQPSSVSLSSAHRPITPPTQEGSSVATTQPRGLASLLETHAVQRILNATDAHGIGQSATALLFEGRLPDKQEDRDYFVNWMLLAGEPALTLAMLKLGNLTVMIGSERPVEALLNAVRLEPAASFPNVVLKLILEYADEAERVVSALVELISANNSFNSVKIDWYAGQGFHLGELFAALSTIEGLKLTTGGCFSMPPEDVGHVADLSAQNQAIHTLELHNLPSDPARGPLHDNTLRLCKTLEQQKHLVSLAINCLTEQCQESLGAFIESSPSIRTLSLFTVSVALAPRLVEGIRKNKTLQAVNVKIEKRLSAALPSEQNALPFTALFEENSGTATSLSLDVSACSAESFFRLVQDRTADRHGLTAIGSLIANNHTIQTLALRLPKSFGIDILGIGEGLQRNLSLGSLHISFIAHLPEAVPWILCINGHGWPEFVGCIADNRTITEIVFETVNRDETHAFQDEKITRILSFNKNLSLLCSEAYIKGAASGLMHTLGYATDPSSVVAEHLLAHRPRIAARALAIVNKTSNQNAVAARRRETLDLIADRLPGNRVRVEKALCAIAECAFLGADLFYWMEADPAAYLNAITRFSEVAGAGMLREQIIAQFSDASDLTAQRLAMLERTFAPDQKHLGSLLDEALDYDSIEPAVLRFFVGYNVLDAGSDSTSVKEWCERNARMPLYRAYLQKLSAEQARHLQKLV